MTRPARARRKSPPSRLIKSCIGASSRLRSSLVALRPRIGAYVVAGWLVGIMIDLILRGNALDIVLRDFGLCLGALALARLSVVYDARGRGAQSRTF